MKKDKDTICDCDDKTCCSNCDKDEELKIDVIDTEEHDDGGMTVTLDMNEEAVKFLISKAVIQIIKDSIEWEDFGTKFEKVFNNGD